MCDRSHVQNDSTHPRHASVLGPYWQPVAGCAAGELQKEQTMTARRMTLAPAISKHSRIVRPPFALCGLVIARESGRRRRSSSPGVLSALLERSSLYRDGVDGPPRALRDAARRGGAAPSPEGGSEPESRSSTELERWLRCAACGEPIVRESAQLVVSGSHEHSFLNPSGVRFIVSCWSSAPGCVSEGERSTVWTWFPGFAWQAEVCRSCAVHLGWSFHARSRSSSTFYGLIRDRLVRS